MAKVAVITRTKDRPTFLERAIESVANQTYKNYIHIIVNDGGDRNSIENLVANFEKPAKKNIKVFHHKTSSNAPDTIFNSSVNRVKSEYVVIHDDDDTWHPEFLERSVKVLDEGVAGVVVKTDKIVEELQGKRVKRLKTEAWMPDLSVVNLYTQCVVNQLTPISFIYRRSAYEAVGGYDNSLPVAGDWEFGIRFLQKYDVEFLDPGFALANYHRRSFKPGVEGNTSYAGNDRQKYYSNIIMNRYLRKELAEGKLGIGYLMSQLRYERNFVTKVVERALPRFITNRLKNRIRD